MGRALPVRIIMNENIFQASVIRKIKKMLPGCVVLKNDPNYIQGFPDLLILFEDSWAALECKKTGRARRRPNQDYYIEKLNNMSYAAFISPDNEEDVLYELVRALRAC